jgi:hypothetical protein
MPSLEVVERYERACAYSQGGLIWVELPGPATEVEYRTKDGRHRLPKKMRGVCMMLTVSEAAGLASDLSRLIACRMRYQEETEIESGRPSLDVAARQMRDAQEIDRG